MAPHPDLNDPMPAVQVRRERLNIEWSGSRQRAVSHHRCLYLRSYGEPLLFQAPSVSRLTESTRAALIWARFAGAEARISVLEQRGSRKGRSFSGAEGVFGFGIGRERVIRERASTQIMSYSHSPRALVPRVCSRASCPSCGCHRLPQSPPTVSLP